MSNPISLATAEYQLRQIHDSRVPETIASMAVCLSAAYIAVVLRFMSRRVGKIPWKLDDWTLVAGLGFTTASVVGVAGATHFGLGRHAVALSQPETVAKIIVFNEVIYTLAIVSIKASILFLYRRIFTNGCSNTSFNVTLWFTGAFILSYSTCQALLTLLYCTPIEALWDHRIDAKCINFDRALVILSSLNIGTDILILCLPIPQLWRLAMTRRRKYQLMGIFFLGGFVCIASIVRVPYIARLSLVDPTWSDIYGANWSVVGLCLGIVSACLPTLRPLFVHLFRGGRAASPACENTDIKVVKLAEDGAWDKISMTGRKAAEAV